MCSQSQLLRYKTLQVCRVETPGGQVRNLKDTHKRHTEKRTDAEGHGDDVNGTHTVLDIVTPWLTIGK